jgi:hypothetical protein
MNKMRKKSKIVFLMIFLVFFACKEGRRRTEIAQIVTEWVGKTIQFPDIESFCINNEDSPPSESKDYSILLYVDSTGCTSCRLNLDTWKIYIEELGEEVDFLFYFRPKTKGELLSILKTAQFNHPVYIDEQDELNKLNKLPANQSFQCFMLDKDNKVVLIGNPVSNYKIWDLYKNKLSQQE